jgi:glycosyltransferase involved in cell wall biosynthesis
MRILYATPGYKPAYRIGGPILSVSAAAERLVRKGHEVTVVTTNANVDQDIDVPINQPVDVDGVTVWYLRREEPLRKWLPFVPYLSRSMGYMYAPEMRRTLDRLVPQHDVVDTQMPFVYPTYAASRAALRHGKPLFYHQRGNYLETHRGRRRLKKDIFITLFEKPVMRRATALIALTAAERDAFAAVSPGTPCVIVPNGIDVPRPDPTAAERVEARHGIPRDAQLILYLARLHPWKGTGFSARSRVCSVRFRSSGW